MTSLASYTRGAARSRDHEANFGNDHSLDYLLAFAAVGLFFSVIAAALGLDGFAAAAW